MLISCAHLRSVYKSTPGADFSAELLLTQPVVILSVAVFALEVKGRIYFSNCLLFIFLVFSRSLLSVALQIPLHQPCFPSSTHIPVSMASLPRSHGFPHGFSHSPTVSPADSLHGPRNPRPRSSGSLAEIPTVSPASRPGTLHGPSPTARQIRRSHRVSRPPTPQRIPSPSPCDYCHHELLNRQHGLLYLPHVSAWLFGSLLWFILTSGFSTVPLLCLVSNLTLISQYTNNPSKPIQNELSQIRTQLESIIHEKTQFII